MHAGTSSGCKSAHFVPQSVVQVAIAVVSFAISAVSACRYAALSDVNVFGAYFAQGSVIFFLRKGLFDCFLFFCFFTEIVRGSS